MNSSNIPTNETTYQIFKNLTDDVYSIILEKLGFKREAPSFLNTRITADSIKELIENKQLWQKQIELHFPYLDMQTISNDYFNQFTKLMQNRAFVVLCLPLANSAAPVLPLINSMVAQNYDPNTLKVFKSLQEAVKYSTYESDPIAAILEVHQLTKDQVLQKAQAGELLDVLKEVKVVHSKNTSDILVSGPEGHHYGDKSVSLLSTNVIFNNNQLENDSRFNRSGISYKKKR